MPDLKKSLNCLRTAPSVYLGLWCLISMGIVPAIITQNIIPFDVFSVKFGIESTTVDGPPAALGLAMFVIGVALCAVQRRYLYVVLLLPWLALGLVEIDRLTFELPTYSEVQEQLRENYNLVKEGGELPSTDEVRQDLEQIRFARNELLPLDASVILDELNTIDAALAKAGGNLQAQIKSISAGLKQKTREIQNLDRRIRPLEQNLRKIKRLPAGLSALILAPQIKEAERQLKRLKRSRSARIAERNALRAKLDGVTQSQARVGKTYERLFALKAEVKTYLWVSQSHQAWYYSLPYKVLCIFVFLLLVWQFPLISWVYSLTVTGSLLALATIVDAPDLFRLWVLLKFIIWSLIVRSIYLVAVENFPVIRDQSSAFLLRTLKASVKFYSPFIVLIVAGYIATVYTGKFIDEKLYSIDIISNSNPASNTRRYDIDLAIDAYFKQKEEAGHAKLEALAENPPRTVEGVAKRTISIYEDTFKPELPDMNPAFSVPRCDRFYHWLTRPGKCVEKQVKLPVNDTYSETRDDQLVSLQESTALYSQYEDDKVQEVILIARRELSDKILAIRSGIKTQLSRIYFIIDFYSWISLLLLVMIILKSFMYIFSRIFYAAEEFDPKRAIQFERAARPRQRGSIREVSNTLKLTAKMGKYFYVNKKFDFANAPPDEKTPQALKAFFSRFKNKVWHMNLIETAPRENSKNLPYRRIPENERIVIWTLKPGDEVVFSWKTFVGMSDRIKIRTRYSWQLSSLVFGRMFFVVASVDPDSTADGTLLLVAKGNDGIDKAANPSNSPDQLLAWQTTTRFQLQANLNFRNIYRSGIQIKAKDSDLAVMHLNHSKPRSGASVFLKYFVIPS